MKPDERMCYKTSENVLEHSANYSLTLCYLECLTREMIRTCNCRPFQYPGILDKLSQETFGILYFKIITAGDNKHPACGLHQYSCLGRVYGKIQCF